MNHANELLLVLNNQCCCFNLRKITRAITQFYDRQLESVGIRSTQMNLLVALAHSKASTLTELADSLVMDRTTLTRNLRPLEKLGFIQHAEVLDKRSKAYALSDAGREVILKGLPLWEHAQNHVVHSIGTERFDHLLDELKQLKNAAIAPRTDKRPHGQQSLRRA